LHPREHWSSVQWPDARAAHATAHACSGPRGGASAGHPLARTANAETGKKSGIVRACIRFGIVVNDRSHGRQRQRPR
jgi:hypothetical protein